jgi:hypothetical protein
MRFDADERVLLDAIAAYQLEHHGLKLTYTDVCRVALKHLRPPESELGETAASWRRAYKRVFNKTVQVDQ